MTSIKPTWKNWAENVVCTPLAILHPKSEEEFRQLILRAGQEGKRVRVIGSGHSFTPLGDTTEYLVTLQNLKGLISLDKEKKQATIWAGTTIHEAGKLLAEHGLGQVNLGDIDKQSLAGATATGTHGTGTRFGGISTQIVAFTIITANGELVDCSETQHPDLFNAGRISLGALGIITKVTLQLADAYKLKYVASKGNLEETLTKLDEYNAQNRNFEFYCFPYSKNVQLKLSNETDEPVKDSSFKKFVNQRIMENGLFRFICFLGATFKNSFKAISRFVGWGATQETRINYSHNIYASERTVKFKEMEYNIPAEHFTTVLREIHQAIEEKQYRVFFPIECRFVQQDNIWLSPSHGRASAYIAFHTYYTMEHEPYFTDMEAICMKYNGRPHWGKMHNRSHENLVTTYPKWEDFRALRKQLDPKGMFLNLHLEKVFGVQ